MALKEGKKTVSLKASVADNIGIPKFPTTTIGAELAAPIADVISTFQKTAEADAKADWQFNFNQQSRDHYLQLKDKFKFDPDGMRNAIDNYSKTVLSNTPSAFKGVAENLLAQKNLANMNYATTNYEAKKTEDALTGWAITKDEFKIDTGFNLDTITLNPNLSILDINSHIGNVAFKNLNHNYGTAEETLVNTMRYKGTQLQKDLNSDIIDIEALRVFNIMKKVGKVDGINYFTNYAMGNDNLPVTPDDVNNPIFQKYAESIKDPFTRGEIVKKIKNLYDDYNGKNVGALKDVKQKYNLNGLQDPGGILDVNNFRDGKGNATDYVINNMPGISENDFEKAVEIVDKNIKAQGLVNKALNFEIVDTFENDDQKKLFETALLRRYGINDTNITDINNPQFATAMELFKNQNIEPRAVISKLNTNYNVNFKTPGMLDKFKENLALYNYIKSKDMFSTLPIENEFIYKEAENIGIMSMSSNEMAADRLNTIVQDIPNYEKNKTKITTHLAENTPAVVEGFRWAIDNLDINTDTFWLKQVLFPSGKNKYSHMFIPESTSLLPYKTTLTPQAQSVWLNHTINQLTHMYGGKNIDITTDDGKRMFYAASIQALNVMNKEGYGATRFNGTGEITITKNAYEDKVGFTGQGLENAIIAQGNYLKANLSKSEQIERFGGYFKPFSKEQLPYDISDLIKREIDTGMKNIIIEPTGTMNQYGKPNYHLKLLHDVNGYKVAINLTQGDNYFDPTGLGSNKMVSDKLPANRTQLLNTVAEIKFDKFMKNYGQIIDGDSKIEGWIRKFLFSTTKQLLDLGDYKFYPDVPLLDDVPKEVKPFGFIFKMLGKDVSLDQYYEQGAKINNEINEILSYDQQILKNSRISEKDKLIESAFPPHKTSYTQQNLQYKFRQHVYNNIDNKKLPLTFRTNNYMAVMKTDSTWDGEMKDVNTGNQAAVFASPVDSIRAGMRVMINNSSLSPTETTKRYGDNPTVEEILTSYAQDSASYLEALEQKTKFTRDTNINFFDTNQMLKLIKFMIEHEMGDEFNNYYPPENQLFLDGMILEGYRKGINSYGGTLGKIK
jgi:hypothetical protein